MKVFSKVAVACVLFLALAGNAFAATPGSGHKTQLTAGNVMTLTAVDDNIPGVPAPGSPINGTLDENTDWSDVYRVYLVAGETLSISMTGSPGTDFDLYVYAPNATNVEVDAPVALSENDVYPETITYVAPATGTYFMEMYAYAGAGAYSTNYSVTNTSPIRPVWRFYNRANGSHFYTASPTERNNVINTLGAIYSLDGVAYSVNTGNAANNSPLYRFYNKLNGSHFYTASLAEKNNVIATLGSTYAYDGPAYNVCKTPGGTQVWRFYNKTNGSHFYTASLAEKNNVIAKLGNIYALDGTAFYIAP